MHVLRYHSLQKCSAVHRRAPAQWKGGSMIIGALGQWLGCYTSGQEALGKVFRQPDHCRGQASAETLMLVPLYFLLVFGLLQLGQLATALVVVNYGAAAIARQAVAENISGGQDYNRRLEQFFVAGMKNPDAWANPKDPDSPIDPLLRDVRVEACAEVKAFPFVNAILGGALKAGLGEAAKCEDIKTFAYNSSGSGSFVVHAKAKARMNLKPPR